MKKVFNWLVDKWLAGFITTSMFFLLKLYIELPPESKSNFFRFNWFTDILKTRLSLSTVIIILTVVVIFTRIEKALLRSKYRNKESNQPRIPNNAFEHYRRDTFGANKTIWTWNYEWRSYEGKFIISDLKPVCKQCGTSMDIDTSYYLDSTDCYKCRLDGRYSYNKLTERISDVQKEIIRRIQNNEVGQLNQV